MKIIKNESMVGGSLQYISKAIDNTLGKSASNPATFTTNNREDAKRFENLKDALNFIESQLNNSIVKSNYELETLFKQCKPIDY